MKEICDNCDHAYHVNSIGPIRSVCLELPVVGIAHARVDDDNTRTQQDKKSLQSSDQLKKDESPNRDSLLQ